MSSQLGFAWQRISLRTKLTALSVAIIGVLVFVSSLGTVALLRTYLQQNLDRRVVEKEIVSQALAMIASSVPLNVIRPRSRLNHAVIGPSQRAMPSDLIAISSPVRGFCAVATPVRSSIGSASHKARQSAKVMSCSWSDQSAPR
mgnify:CR=1 FL=1